MNDSVFRPAYRKLSLAEEVHISEIKATAEALMNQISEKPGREADIALQHLEECVMWAVKGATA